MDTKHVSKFLSLVLRHKPETIGLTLDQSGWADIDALIRLAGPTMPLTRELIYRAVLENDKQRFALSADGRRIRANQGHSTEVDLQLEARTPPPVLYHGTSAEVVSAVPLSAAQSSDIAAALRTALGKDPEITTRVDPAILGGVKVRVGSRLFDASLKSKLDSLKFALKRA